MSDQKDKTPDQVADEERLKKHHAATDSKEQQATGENYQLGTDTNVEEEMREGVE